MYLWREVLYTVDDVPITSSNDQSLDIKGAFFKPLYLLNYVSNQAEILHVSTDGSVIDENQHNVPIASSSDQSYDIKGAFS